MKMAVLLSTYNGEKFLKTQIDSILNQEGDYIIDLWVRDDGSSDRTKEILSEYSRQNKLAWYSGKNSGPAYSFFDLITHCPKYDYYAFADQDDYWMPDKLNSGIRFLTNSEIPELYFCNAELVDQKLFSMGRNVYKEAPKTDFYTLSCAGGILGCTMIFNEKLAEIIRKHGKPKSIIMHDFYIALLCTIYDGKIIYDSSVHMKYRQHEKNTVGVAYTVIDKLINRYKEIFVKKKISISEQAESILVSEPESISKEKYEWLRKIKNYKKNFKTRLKLAFSHKTNYIGFSQNIVVRLSICMGNR